MIFGSLFRRAEHAVENLLDQALLRVMVAIPLLIAAGFATAAASGYVNARYGSETGNLIMAAVFGAIGLLAAGYVAARSPSNGSAAADSQVQADAMSAATGEAAGQGTDSSAPPLSDGERELFNSVLTSAAPIALPGLIRLLLRNIPLLLTLIVAGYVLSRQTGNSATEQPAAS